jgi:hypothetical protein
MRISSPVVALLLLAACSLIGLEHNDPMPVFPSGEPDGILIVDLEAEVDGPGVAVDVAVGEHLGGGKVRVQGALFIDDTYGTAWLCQETMQAQGARQPSCARPALLLQHSDAGGLQVSEVLGELIEAGRVDELQEVDAVRWTDDATFDGSIVDPLTEPN